MTDDHARIETRHDEDGVPVLALIGDFDLTNAGQLRGSFAELPSATGAIVIDMESTTFMDSQAINTLATAMRDGFTLTIRGSHGSVRRALEVTGIDRLVRLED